MSDRQNCANPFIGMRAFDYADRAVFFGRELQTYALYRLTNFGFVSVVGDSGSGKSSLVRAGLIPLLRDAQERRPWRIATMTPGGEALERLADAVSSFAPIDEDDDARTVRRDRIAFLLRRKSTGIADALLEMNLADDEQILLVVDQFEEIFRYSNASAREGKAAFVQLLLQLNRHLQNAHVLVTMRSDFIGDCAQYIGLPEAVSNAQFLVPSLTRFQIRAAIVKPIEAAGASMDPMLVERLINDLGVEQDRLPVLEHALAQMWISAARRSPKSVHIMSDDYVAIGTLQGAISQHAETVMAELDGLERVVEAVFRALSERDADGRAIRRIVSFADLVLETGLPQEDIRAVVDRFRAPDCAFLAPSHGALTSTTRVDVVHEALLRRWARISSNDPMRPGWLDREEEDGRYYRSLLTRIDGGETTLQLDRVRERYAWWTATPHTTAWACRYGGRHDRVQQFFTDSLAALGDFERERLQAAHDERERQTQKAATARRFLIVSGSIATVAILLLIATFFALLESQRTTNRSLVVASHFLSRDARAATSRGDAADGALLALQALPAHLAGPDRPFTWEAYAALRDAAAHVHEIHTYNIGGDVVGVTFAPDQRHFIARPDGGRIEVWRIGARKPDRVLIGHRRYAWDAQFSADEKRIISASTDGTARIWDLATGTELHVLRADGQPIRRALFSRDGRRVLIAADDGSTRIFDASSGRPLIVRFDGQPETDVSQPDVRSSIVLRYLGGKIVEWNASLTKPLRTFQAKSNVIDLDFSPDGSKIVMAHENGSAEIIDGFSKKIVVRFSGGEGAIEHVRFGHDGRRVFATGLSGERVWDARTGALVANMTPDARSNTSNVYLSVDERRIVAGHVDGSIEIWSTETGARLLLLAGHENDVEGIALRSDDAILLTTSPDGTIREWSTDANVPVIIPNLGAHEYAGAPIDVAITHDGRFVAAPDARAVHVYDAETGTQVAQLNLTDEKPAYNDESDESVAFSPDGRTLLVSFVSARTRLPHIELWRWRSDTIERTFVVGQISLTSVRAEYAPDGRSIIARDHLRAYIWDLRTGRVRLILTSKYGIIGARFSNDSRSIVAATGDDDIRVFDAKTGAAKLAFHAHDAYIFDTRFSPDDRLIASASADRTARVWDATTGMLLTTDRNSGATYSVDFSPNGRQVLVAGESGAHVWDIDMSAIVFGFYGYRGGIDDAHFDRSGNRVVTLGVDGTLRIWSVPRLPDCEAALRSANASVSHALGRELIDEELISDRRQPSILNVLLPHVLCR